MIRLTSLTAALAIITLAAPCAAQDPVSFAERLAAARANPGAADWTALRAAYAASPAYDPDAGSTPQSAAAAAALSRTDYKLAAELAGLATDHDWMDLRAHMLGMLACARDGEAAHAAAHKAAYNGLLHALLATGDGASPATAYRVLAASEAYMVLAYGHLHLRGETALQTDGHIYHVLTASHVPDLKVVTVFVNVDQPFARETALAAGPIRH